MHLKLKLIAESGPVLCPRVFTAMEGSCKRTRVESGVAVEEKKGKEGEFVFDCSQLPFEFAFVLWRKLSACDLWRLAFVNTQHMHVFGSDMLWRLVYGRTFGGPPSGGWSDGPALKLFAARVRYAVLLAGEPPPPAVLQRRKDSCVLEAGTDVPAVWALAQQDWSLAPNLVSLSSVLREQNIWKRKLASLEMGNEELAAMAQSLRIIWSCEKQCPFDGEERARRLVCALQRHGEWYHVQYRDYRSEGTAEIPNFVVTRTFTGAMSRAGLFPEPWGAFDDPDMSLLVQFEGVRRMLGVKKTDIANMLEMFLAIADESDGYDLTGLADMYDAVRCGDCGKVHAPEVVMQRE